MTTATIALTAVMTSFAGTDTSGPGCEPKYSGLSDIVYELFSGVEDDLLRQMATDTARVMIGEKKPEKVFSNGAVQIGTYTGEQNLNIVIMISLLGDSQMLMALGDDDKICLMTGLDYVLDEAAIEENRSDLMRIYGIVKFVRNAVNGMDDAQKLHYIQEFIRQAVPTYVADSSPVIARTLGSGTADCDGYSAIVWFLGENIGLQIDVISGFVNIDGPHAWNDIIIDGREYYCDVTWDVSSGSDKYFLMDPDSFTSDKRRVCPNALELVVGYVEYS